jgi:hypothetical protein
MGDEAEQRSRDADDDHADAQYLVHGYHAPTLARSKRHDHAPRQLRS